MIDPKFTLLRNGLCLATATLTLALSTLGITAADAKLPAAKDIVANFVKAMGGKEIVLKQTSTRMTGKMEIAGPGINGPVEILASAPNKFLLKITLTGIGETKTGFDGKVGWTIDPIQGAMLLEGKMLDQLKEQADFYSSLHEDGKFTSMETQEQTTFEGRNCYKVKLVRKGGQEVTEYYEVATGMLFGVVSVQESPLGAIPATNLLSDYKSFAGIKMPTKLTQKVGPMEIVITVEQVEQNKVNPAVFDLPEQIKALVNKK